MSFTIPNEADAGNANQAEPDSIDFAILAAALQGSAVVAGCVPSDGASGLQVDVAVGAVIVDGTPVVVDSGTVTPGTADGTNPRFDLVTVNSSGTLSVTAGTAAANPVFPSIPSNSVVLAAVYIAAGATTLATADIVDKRFVVGWRALDTGRMVSWTSAGDVNSPYVQVNVGFQSHQSSGTRTVAAIGSGPAQGSKFDTGASSGTLAGEQLQNQPNWADQQRAFYEGTFKLDQTTDIRFFAGFGAIVSTDSDNPQNGGTLVNDYAALQYSTPRSDTNFQYISNDDAGQEITDSGVAADTSWHTIRVLLDEASGRVLFELDGGNRVVHSGSAPILRQYAYMEMTNQAAASKTFVRGHIKCSFGVHP